MILYFNSSLLKIVYKCVWMPRGVGNGNLSQYSCLENSMDRRTCQPIVWGCKESDMTEHAHIHSCLYELKSLAYLLPQTQIWNASILTNQYGFKSTTQ